MTELMTRELGTCQVRSGTARPCVRPAVTRFQGIPFCESCAREQETYFAIGEFTEAEERASDESLAAMLDLMSKIRSRQRAVRDHRPDAA